MPVCAEGPAGLAEFIVLQPRQWLCTTSDRCSKSWFLSVFHIIKKKKKKSSYTKPQICHLIQFKVYNWVAFSAFMVLCNHYHYQNSERFHHPTGNPIPISHSLSPVFPAPGTHHSSFVLPWALQIWPFLGLQYTESNNMYPFVSCLTSQRMISSRSIHVIVCGGGSFP